MSRSLISNKRECIICGKTNVHKHHIFFGTANRSKSELYGCWCYLCAGHHNGTDYSVHFNRPFDIMLRMYCQALWEGKYGNRDAFRSIFGRSYLDDDNEV